jgi:hypothetical protein
LQARRGTASPARRRQGVTSKTSGTLACAHRPTQDNGKLQRRGHGPALCCEGCGNHVACACRFTLATAAFWERKPGCRKRPATSRPSLAPVAAKLRRPASRHRKLQRWPHGAPKLTKRHASCFAAFERIAPPLAERERPLRHTRPLIGSGTKHACRGRGAAASPPRRWQTVVHTCNISRNDTGPGRAPPLPRKGVGVLGSKSCLDSPSWDPRHGVCIGWLVMPQRRCHQACGRCRWQQHAAISHTTSHATARAVRGRRWTVAR